MTRARSTRRSSTAASRSAPNAEWVRIIEFYCPGCGRQVETEYLPPGHPITHDTEMDVDALKARLAAGEPASVDEAGSWRCLAMSRTIDIDVGGTFTDLVLTWDERPLPPRRPRRPTTCRSASSTSSATAPSSSGVPRQLLPQVELVRYSTTVAMNRLIERKGPRLGLLTTEGHEDAILIGRGAQWTDGTRICERRNLSVQTKPAPLVERRHDRRRRRAGRLHRPGAARRSTTTTCGAKLRQLVDNGARAIAVSLLWSFVNPAHERRIREIIREEYKGYHVGYLPVVLSHEVVGKVGEYERTMTAILDAYLQTLDQVRAGVHLGPAAEPRLPGHVPAHPQHRRLRGDLQDHRVAGPTTAVRSPG